MTAPEKRLVPIPEARTVLGGIGNTTIYDLIKRGDLKKVNIGRRGFVTSESLTAFLDQLEAEEIRSDVDEPIHSGLPEASADTRKAAVERAKAGLATA